MNDAPDDTVLGPCLTAEEFAYVRTGTPRLPANRLAHAAACPLCRSAVEGARGLAAGADVGALATLPPLPHRTTPPGSSVPNASRSRYVARWLTAGAALAS